MIPKNNIRIVQKFDKNINGRDFVVGDIHGCYFDFMELLKQIKFDKSVDRMFSVGDLIDRGPNSLDCAELMYEKWMYVVRANHEQMMIDCILQNGRQQADMWAMNGGSWHIEVDFQLLKAIAEDMDRLPYIIVIGTGKDRINICHAELVAATDIDIDQWDKDNDFTPHWQRNNIIWGRSICYNPTAIAADLSLTFVGHTPMGEPMFHEKANHVYIDTACFMRYRLVDVPQDGRLTCADITDKYNIKLISWSGLHSKLYTNELANIQRIT